MKKETLLHSSKIQKMIMQYKFDMQQVDHLMELAEPHYQIEPDLYMKYEVKRGLRDLDGRGVRAGLTTISKVSATQLVDGKEVSAPGQLLYRGIPIDQLVQGFITHNRFGFEDIMAMENGFLQYTMKLLERDYAKELKMLGVTLPNVEQIPAVRFDEAKQKVAEKYHRQIRNPYDLEPEEEALIGQYYKEECGADFVFVTHYPSKKRPFYAMDDPADPTYTLSFDLLYHGLEITTGGQRIHDYQMLLDKIEKRGMTTEGMEQYLAVFKYGMPPHGGLGIGLERLTMKLVGEDNVRETTLFPRDLSRLEP